MARYAALLRAVNVGGTGKLAMKDLVKICERLGFGAVRTYIQSGNVVFESRLGEEAIRTKLEKALVAKIGKPTAAVVRSQKEMKALLKANPFAKAEPSKVLVYLETEKIGRATVDAIVTPGGEEVRAGKREIYVHFPNGQGKSKIKMPKVGTMRNVNTITRLVEMMEQEDAE